MGVVDHLEQRLEHGGVRDEGVDIPMPPVGVMIEIPAAVYQTRELARQVDFLS
ncbi:putative PEP-binding protein, partial [Metapseudomonas otitidis]|uniref:putative PEP-binding protein n=1 Tax=Metapseudomonas otitidis TaxID=319939 RepID=UPI00374DDEB6